MVCDSCQQSLWLVPRTVVVLQASFVSSECVPHELAPIRGKYLQKSKIHKIAEFFNIIFLYFLSVEIYTQTSIVKCKKVNIWI